MQVREATGASQLFLLTLRLSSREGKRDHGLWGVRALDVDYVLLGGAVLESRPLIELGVEGGTA